MRDATADVTADVTAERVAGLAPVQDSFHPVDSRDSTRPAAKLAELRRTCPVSVAVREGFPNVTVVTRYEDVAATFRNYRRFGNIGSDPDPTRHDATPIDERTIIALDPPVHTWARRLNNLAMAPGAVDQSLDYIAGVAKRIVADFAGRGEAELVGEWAELLPSRAITRVLGLPERDAGLIHEWVLSQFTETAVKESGRRYGRSSASGGDFGAYLVEQVERRRGADAPDDVISRMVAYRRDDGSAFTNVELSTHIRVLLAAGNETTTSLMSNLMYRLVAQPGLYERVVQDRSLLGPAIEESLRLDAPLQVIIRRANGDDEIGGTRVEHGDVIALSTLSANRDEAVWGDDAERFDIERFTRQPTPAHIGFGLGVHHCVGAYLARQTTRLGVEALLDVIPSMQLERGYEYENVYYHIFHRPRRLPVTFPE
jgi:cytochrome P450